MRGRLVVRVSPSDVGSRVSLRFHADGGGFTDVVGRLIVWDGGVLTVERRDGSTVELPAARLAAAKVIPESPPRRRR